MNESVFGREYADQYDLLYGDKDYESECDLIEEVFHRYGEGKPVQTILDLGCGTGSHASPLQRRAYQVTGVDRSEEMIRLAREKGKGPVFLHGDIRTLDLRRPFDAVIMMFAVLGYQLTNEEVISALRTVRRHLTPGGLFIADVWYGPAVLTIGPGERTKVIPAGSGKVIRAASGTLDVAHHLCEVRYRLSRVQDGRAEEAEETHRMRFFFPLELEFMLQSAGLRMESLTAFPDLSAVPDRGTWNALIVARGVAEGA